MDDDFVSDTTAENYLRNVTEIFSSNEKTGNANNGTSTVYESYPAWILWFGTICCIVYTVVGSIGNFVSILALVRCKKLKNATTAFIVNLCTADLVYCSFSIPLTAVTFVDRDWKYGDALCKMSGLLRFSNGMISIFSVVAIALNRYVLIVHPQMYRALYSRRNTAASVACLWIVPVLFILLPLFDVWGTIKYNPAIGNCGVNNLHGKSPRNLILFAVVVLPSVVFIYCYVKIYVVFRRTTGKVQKQSEIGQTPKLVNTFQNARAYVDLKDRKDLRLLRICLVIFCFYMITVFPLIIVKLLKKEKDLPVLNVLSYLFLFSSSVMNPFIYVVMSREYRQAYKDLFTAKLC